MAEVYVIAERLVGAPAERVYELISDFQTHHSRFLPRNFTNLEIECGGIGAGTIITFTATAGGQSRNYRFRIGEPEPGHVMTESDTLSNMVTTWTVSPEGEQSRVRIETRWEGTPGFSGLFERTFAPMAMRRIYNDELRRLDRYARELAQHQEAVVSHS